MLGKIRAKVTAENDEDVIENICVLVHDLVVIIENPSLRTVRDDLYKLVQEYLDKLNKNDG